MRILHAPQNIGGMAGALAAAQRRLGHDAVSFSTAANAFQFRSDIMAERPSSWRRAVAVAARLARSFDVFHFYFGESLLGASLADVRLLRAAGKTVAFYFCGCDIRDEKQTLFSQRYSACSECFPKLCSANRERAQFVAERYANVNFVSTPDLLEFLPRAVLLPQVIDLDLIDRVLEEPAAPRDDDVVRVVHAPSNRLIKGTRYVEAAVEQLRSEGVAIELSLLENMPHDEAMRRAQAADIAVDQVLAGAYGQFAAEMMALGVPVVSYVRDDLVDEYPEEPPLAVADPESLVKVLRDLANDRGRRTRLGVSGFGYARRVHAPDVLAELALAHYA